MMTVSFCFTCNCVTTVFSTKYIYSNAITVVFQIDTSLQ